jgi:hypothetical protein
MSAVMSAIMSAQEAPRVASRPRVSSALSSAEHLAVHLLLFGLLALDLGVHALHEFGHRRIIRRELGTALQVDLGLIVLTLGLTSGRATEEGLDAARIEEERLVA